MTRRIFSLRTLITAAFFAALLALLVGWIALTAYQRHADDTRLQALAVADLDATWATALEASGLNASRQVPALLDLLAAGATAPPPQGDLDPFRASYGRIDQVDAQGRLLRSTGRPAPTAGIVDNAAFTTPLRYQGFLVGLIPGELTGDGRLAILVCLPAPGESYLLATRPLAAIAPLLGQGIRSHWMLRDRQGRSVEARMPDDLQAAAQALNLPWGGQGGVRDHTLDGRVYEVVSLPIDGLDGRQVASLESIRDVTEQRQLERSEDLLVFGLGLGLILLATLFLHHRLAEGFEPLGELAEAVRRMAGGDLYAQPAVRSQAREIDEIARSVDVFQRNAIAADLERFRGELLRSADRALIETQMQRLGETLAPGEREALERQTQAVASERQLGHAFQLMVDRVMAQQTHLSELLAERTRDLALVRQALDERNQLARLREELEIARHLQISNLPGDAAMQALAPWIDLHAVTQPAREVGGDFYDFSLAGGRYLLLVLGDASGKGVSAAMFGMMARVLVKASLEGPGAPGQALQVANRALAAENDALMFATAFAAVLDLHTGELRYASAGHNPCLVVHRDGRRTWLDQARGLVLGAMDDTGYDSESLVLAEGDLLLVYSDGVTEAHDRDDRLFGEERLARHLPPGLTARQATDEVLAAVNRFCGETPQFDDISLMALRFRGIG